MKTLTERLRHKRLQVRSTPKPVSLVLRGRLIDLRHTHLMGILNVTPDSFSDGGQYLDTERALSRLTQLLEEGATFVDVGGESSRPGAQPVLADEELKRIEPLLSDWAKEPKGILSVDTHKASVAEAALRYGASLINDITALKGDPRMGEVIASYGAGVVLMHMQGAPQTMQENPHYHDLIGEILAELEAGMNRARRAGIREDAILLDPGIGFGKTVEQNLEILRNLLRFRSLGRPLVLGTSRKSFIGKILNQPVEERLWGTAATVALAVAEGAEVLRVHEVGPMRQVVLMTEAIVRA